MDKLPGKMTTKDVVKRNKQKTTSLPINQPTNKNKKTAFNTQGLRKFTQMLALF